MSSPLLRTITLAALSSIGAYFVGCTGDCRQRDTSTTQRPAASTDAPSADPFDVALRPLMGEWVSQESGRHLRGVRVGNSVEFRVTNAAEWQDLYQVDDIRFVLRPSLDAPTLFLVEDHSRMSAPENKLPSTRYTEQGRRNCSSVNTKYQDKPITASYDDTNQTLAITFLSLTAQLTYTGSEGVSDCQNFEVIGTNNASLRKVTSDSSR